MRKTHLCTHLAAALLAGTAMPTAAWAQEASAPTDARQLPEAADGATDAEPEATPGDIVVTGSRLATGFQMPTPVTAITAEELNSNAPTTVAESLQQIPSLSGTQVTSSSGRGSGASQTNGQSLLNLRGLGSYRTLVLVNGNRLGPTNVVGSVDVNIIPKELIQRVDVVTGGASASYGSDAVAGVANFILDTRFSGLRLSVNKGLTTYGDAPNTSVSAAFGTALGERARIVGSVDIYRSKGIGYYLTGRKWLDFPESGYTNPAGTAPTTITPTNVRAAAVSYGGYINSVAGCPAGATGNACRALAGQQFVDGGALVPFNPGTFTGSAFQSGGDGPLAINGISPDTERESFFAHAEFDLTPDATLWAEGIRSRSWTYDSAQPPRQNGTTSFTIYEGNAYLPAATAAVLAATPGTQTFRLSRYDIDWPTTDVLGATRVLRGAVGVKGTAGSWSYDGNVAYQHSHQDLDIYNTLERNKYAAADAVLNPATGQIVCRSTLMGYDPACVPINLFGYNVSNTASTDYMMDWNTADITLNQFSTEYNVRGNLPFGLSAGQVSSAFGVAARELTARRVVDANSAISLDGTGVRGFPASLQGRYGGYQFYNPSNLSGKTSIYEGYAELGVPILKDVPVFQSLDATLAGRYTHYSQSGWEPTWKLGLNWTVAPALRFRANYSQDSRAPSVIELFNTALVTQGSNVAPYTGATTQYRTTGQNITLGNTALSPEKARTLTVGAVLSLPFLPGFQASIDYYRIKISDAILPPGTQNIIDRCYLGDADFCRLIQFNGAPASKAILESLRTDAFIVVTNPLLNLGNEKNEGLDGEMQYRTALGSGNLRLRFTGNYQLDVRAPNGCIPGQNEVGSLTLNCPYPRFRGNLSASYDVGPFSLFLQERFISAGKKDKSFVEGVTIDDNHVPATWYTDLNLAVRLGRGLGGEAELTFNVTNLFDQDPPSTSTTTRSWVEPSNNGIYDLLGRRFVAGVRFRM